MAVNEWARDRRVSAKHTRRTCEAKVRQLNFANFNVGGQTVETVDFATSEYDMVILQEVARGEEGVVRLPV